LSIAGPPGNGTTGSPVPEADRWNAMLRLSGDQLAELPRVRYCTLLPSLLIRYRSVRLGGLPGAAHRGRSNTIHPLRFGASAANESLTPLFVRRTGSVPSGFIM